MSLDARDLDGERQCDLFIAVAVGDQASNLKFALRQAEGLATPQGLKPRRPGVMSRRNP